MSRRYAIEGIADVRVTETASRNLDYHRSGPAPAQEGPAVLAAGQPRAAGIPRRVVFGFRAEEAVPGHRSGSEGQSSRSPPPAQNQIASRTRAETMPDRFIVSFVQTAASAFP